MINLPMLLNDLPEPTKTCGECTACCTVMAIPETKKPMYQTCEHLGCSGCSIYAERPLSCRSWSCLWLLGIIEGDERRRPDRLGLIFDMVQFPSVGRGFLVCYEVWPDALQNPQARYVLQRVEARYSVAVVRHGQTKPELPPALAEWLPSDLEERERAHCKALAAKAAGTDVGRCAEALLDSWNETSGLEVLR